MQVIERTEGHYDVEEVEFGTVYRWCPERGSDHAAIAWEVLSPRRVGNETIHPWHYAGDRQDVGLPC